MTEVEKSAKKAKHPKYYDLLVDAFKKMKKQQEFFIMNFDISELEQIITEELDNILQENNNQNLTLNTKTVYLACKIMGCFATNDREKNLEI